jgi:hypothetical protein
VSCTSFSHASRDGTDAARFLSESVLLRSYAGISAPPRVIRGGRAGGQTGLRAGNRNSGRLAGGFVVVPLIIVARSWDRRIRVIFCPVRPRGFGILIQAIIVIFYCVTPGREFHRPRQAVSLRFCLRFGPCREASARSRLHKDTLDPHLVVREASTSGIIAEFNYAGMAIDIST